MNDSPFMTPIEAGQFSKSLPIYDFRDTIIESVRANQVTIIVAETGAGKSTQVPQYLAEAGYQKVIVTQPRILAARNLSRRVGEEWQLQTGNGNATFVGYRTAHERDDTDATNILYCTDGLQLVREITGSGTTSRQVLVLDEVHEWNENMEVLIAWAKKRCKEDKTFKVVVMSATIEADKLASYFGTVPPITVPGRLHEVTFRRGRDILHAIEKKLSAKVASNILVFLPGKAEIENVAAAIEKKAKGRGVPVLQLHGQLDAETQQQAFKHYPEGKIVLATNVAQTSVTIDDIDVVIDSGLERRSEVQNGVEGLFIAQVSRADCLQRAGRAGRTKVGEYILAPLDDLPCLDINDRSAYPVPEILRKHIDRLVLRLANAGLDIEELEFYHAPSGNAITTAKQTLRALGALGKKGEVTPVGRKMERFPVESSYARMLVEAQQYDETVQVKLAAVIAIQEVGGIVKGGSRFSGWKQFTRETKSDLLAQYDVLLAVPRLLPDEHEDLGIITKNVEKAKEVFERLERDLGHARSELGPVDPREREALLRCIIAGQIDQLWVVDDAGEAIHIGSHARRELSGSSVVLHPRLVAGTAFDLQIPTVKGLEVLHLVQNITRVDPLWLGTMAPHLFTVRPGKIYYDPYQKHLAMRQIVSYGGKPLDGLSSAITERSSRYQQLFIELYSRWIWDKLERERRSMQNSYGRKIPQVNLSDVQARVRSLAAGALSLDDVPPERRRELQKASYMRTYLDDAVFAKISAVRSASGRQSRQSRPWQPRHKRKYDRRKGW